MSPLWWWWGEGGGGGRGDDLPSHWWSLGSQHQWTLTPEKDCSPSGFFLGSWQDSTIFSRHRLASLDQVARTWCVARGDPQAFPHRSCSPSLSVESAPQLVGHFNQNRSRCCLRVLGSLSHSGYSKTVFPFTFGSSRTAWARLDVGRAGGPFDQSRVASRMIWRVHWPQIVPFSLCSSEAVTVRVQGVRHEARMPFGLVVAALSLDCQ